MHSSEPACGWQSTYRKLRDEKTSAVISQLRKMIENASGGQMRAWSDSVKQLQGDLKVVIERHDYAQQFHVLLEYPLPMESRRPDAVLLMKTCVAVLEFKSDQYGTDAAIDQVHAYARDLANYHRVCHERRVVPILVPMRMQSASAMQREVMVCGPSELDGHLAALANEQAGSPIIDPAEFLANDSYQPLPSLITAARALFADRSKLPQVWKSASNTDAAFAVIDCNIIRAKANRKRLLIFCTGLPGAGKTLVGLRAVHALYDADEGKQTCSYVSGNDPLVSALHYMFEKHKVAGKAMIKRARDFIARRRGRKSPEHIIVFDEAQRAHDSNRVMQTSKNTVSQTEPHELLDIAQARPDWSVVVALVGEGQAINDGEERGIKLWSEAISEHQQAGWEVIGPEHLAQYFADEQYTTFPPLHLDRNIRSHFCTSLHKFAQGTVARQRAATHTQRQLAEQIQKQGFDMYLTRDFDAACDYLHERYAENEAASYGLLAPARDNDLAKRTQVDNSFQATKNRRIGPWLVDLDCRSLKDCCTEFEIQGLELDAVLLAWGTDFLIDSNGEWSVDRGRKYKKHKQVQDPWQLRSNAYRVLLTRARDALIIYIPDELPELNATYDYFAACGLRTLGKAS